MPTANDTIFNYDELQQRKCEHNFHDSSQCGKEITIYAFNENRACMQSGKILQEKCDALLAKNIKPGRITPGKSSSGD